MHSMEAKKKHLQWQMFFLNIEFLLVNYLFTNYGIIFQGYFYD